MVQLHYLDALTSLDYGIRARSLFLEMQNSYHQPNCIPNRQSVTSNEALRLHVGALDFTIGV